MVLAHPLITQKSRFSRLAGFGFPEDLVKAYGIRPDSAVLANAAANQNAAPEGYPLGSSSDDDDDDDENGAALLSEIQAAIAHPCRSNSPGSVRPPTHTRDARILCTATAKLRYVLCAVGFV